MISAVIFDLDGTLVETESLKAQSYATAATELCPGCASEQDVVKAFQSMVGHSRQEVAQTLVQRFGLEEASRSRMSEFGVNTPWQAYVQARLQIFDRMIDDPDIIRSHRIPQNIALLHEVRDLRLRTALTTTSSCRRTTQILNVLGLLNEFEFIATADDVEHTKPDPEVYCLVLGELKLSPDACITIEDSVAGAQAALAAGVQCIMVPTDFTRDAVMREHPVADQWVVKNPSDVSRTVHQMINEHGGLLRAA